MSTVRGARPLIEKGCLLLRPRDFHATPFIRARPAPKRSPKVRATNPPAGGLRIKRTYEYEESLPPIALLNAARKSGALAVEPDQALEFLREYQALAGKSNAGWKQRLCDEHDILPSTMALLAGILKRCHSGGQKALAKSVMLAASRLGEKAATFDIISEALRVGTLYEYRAPLERLGTLAKKDNDPQAMTLLGKVLMAERRENEALDWFRRATREPTGGLDFDGAGEALVSEGRILSQRNDRNGAKAAFEKAALELDDPSAYFYLAQLQEHRSSNQQVYLLKAASSGVVEAWHNLGALELEKLNTQERKPTSLDDYGMAREWFQVAAAEGFGLSMINMAIICKAVGQMDEALKWLEKAGGAEGVRSEAIALKRQWEASVS
ncbi:HCP-like protein [Hyaloscypha bicolor E]|uniref:HCP-like protein n=1 Tax=Hyaloscypha bicolor E TaxID=1095630 RepID=A0A2J6SFP1_9HELO|nr:HCP-like protein [Hyaloscypha bicolor E]PMD49573.1 HCP-like protein [Hyaloscypha bicolor E]